MSLHAFKRDGAWPWLANENMFCIVVHDAEGGYLTDLSVPSEDLAETVLALLNGRSVAPVSEPLPPGVTPNPPTYTLAAGVPSPTDGWEWQDQMGDWFLCLGNVLSFPRTIRRVAVVEPAPPPPPETVEVPLHELAGHRLPGCDWAVNQYVRRADGNYEAILNDHGMGMICSTTDRTRKARFTVSPSGMVTVLVGSGEAATSDAPTSAQADR